MLDVVIFSKDRACQLDLLIRSVKRYFAQWERSRVHVLYTWSSAAFARGYEIVRADHRELTYVCERDRSAGFRELVLDIVGEERYVMFLVDDDVFKEPFSLDCAEFNCLAENPQLMCLSLRMCPRMNYTYTYDRLMEIPAFEQGVIWDWTTADGDWGYPMSIDGHIFRTTELAPLIRTLEFTNPNTFESVLATHPLANPIAICFEESKLINLPVNRVQDTFPNRHGDITAESLNDRFLAGARLSLHTVNGVRNCSPHCEIPLEWERHSREVPTAAAEKTAPRLSSRVTQPCDLLAMPDAADLIAAGERRYAEGDLPGAEEAFVQAVGVAPHSLDARHDLAVVLYTAGRPAEAMAQAKAVLESDAAFDGALTTLGACQVALGHPAGARTLARAAVADRRVETWRLLATARRAAGDPAGARAALAEAAAIGSDEAWDAVASELAAELLSAEHPFAPSSPGAGGGEPVAAIVVASAEPALLATTLESLDRQTAPAAEVVVVDDASEDGLAATAATLAARLGLHLETVTLAQPAGGAVARAEGLKRTISPLVVALEAGDELVPDALATLATALAEAPGATLAYAVTELTDGEEPLPAPMPWTAEGILGAAPHRLLALLRREALATAGGYRLDAVGLADSDMLLRARAAGLSAVSVPRYLLREPALLAAARSEDAAADLVLPRLVLATPEAFDITRVSAATAAVTTAGQVRAAPWFAARGDATLRLDYPLDGRSVVVDAGGYEGNWSADILARYGCTIHCFEPVEAFAAEIAARFAGDPRVHVHPTGLAASSRAGIIHLAADSTSVFGEGERVPIRLTGVREAFSELAIEEVHLLKVNIEGCEYELCEELLRSGLIARVRDLQVQFHNFVPEARRWRNRIRHGLACTHELTYDYPFTWENWHRR